MATVALTKDTFDKTVQDNDTVIVDFWAEWCGPCRSFAPTFEAASNEHEDIVFAKVDTEDQQELAMQFGIRSIPTLMCSATRSSCTHSLAPCRLQRLPILLIRSRPSTWTMFVHRWPPMRPAKNTTTTTRLSTLDSDTGLDLQERASCGAFSP